VNLAMHIVSCFDDLCYEAIPICRKEVATGWLKLQLHELCVDTNVKIG